MSSKASGDDPMDLGPFLQNYVMKNPFKVQQAVKEGRDSTVGARAGCMTLRCRAAAEKERLASLSASLNREDESTTLNGAEDDGLSSQSAELLLHNSEASNKADVTTWLCKNYRCLPGQHRLLVATQHLLLRVQQVFPHITSDTIDDFVVAAFPQCMKSNNKKSGLSFYRGLVARPDPEVYENPLFLAALNSVTSSKLTTHQAAEKYGVRESALLAAISWSDIDDIPVSSSSVQDNQLQMRSTTRKRQHVTESEQHSPDEPQHRRCRSSDDDAVDFEMMLQDAVFSNDKSKKSDCPVSSPLLEDNCAHRVAEEYICVKTEPASSPDSQATVNDLQTQPINFCLSVNSQQNSSETAAINVKQTCANDGKVRPNSPHVAALQTPSASCSHLHSNHQQDELAEAIAANLALQEELSARDFHLAQLAEDFFCLHEHFKQLARHFQTVLRDIQPIAADQTSTNRVSHNHTS